MRGRRNEWAKVLGLLESVTGPGGADGDVLLVEGEPGMGKSLLLAEAVTAAAGRDMAPAIAAPCPLTWQADRLWAALERHAREGALLMALDDLQWADPATLTALRTLPSRPAGRRVAWLLARRTTPGHDGAARLFDLLEGEGASRITLYPLGEKAMAELVSDTLGAAPREELAALVSQAGGDPSLLLELLTGLREEGSVRLEAGGVLLTGTALPARLHTAVRRRLGQMSGETRHLLQAAAVLGRSFSPEQAAEMLGRPAAALLPAVEEALAAGVLTAGAEELSFRHGLLWRSVLETVPAPIRRAMRRQVEARRAPPRQSAARPAAGEAETLVTLALLAWDEGRLSRGLELAREAAELPHAGCHPRPRAILATMLADLGLLDEAEAMTASAEAEVAWRPAETAEIPILRARLDLTAGRLGSAIERMENALTAAVLDAPLLASSALSVLGTASLRAGDLPRAFRCLEGEPARVSRDAPPYARLRSELTAGQIGEARGGAAGGLNCLRRICEALPRHTAALTGDPAAAAWLVRVAMTAGDRRRADTVVGAAEDIARRNPGLPTLEVTAAHARGVRDRDREALSRAVAGHTDPWARASAAEDLGVLLSAAGDRALAISSLDTALSDYGAAEAARDAARVRGRLRTLGERRRHWITTDHPVSGWSSLTGTELTVCDLVAQGLTNRRAAEQMFISEHTVAFHLRQVFRKLGIRSRVDLARLVVERNGRAGGG